MKIINYMGEKLHFELSRYGNDRLCIEIITANGENFNTLTVNIPSYMLEDKNEIIINGNVSDNFIEKLENLGILTNTHKYAHSGYGVYKVMIFNQDKAKDYSREV